MVLSTRSLLHPIAVGLVCMLASTAATATMTYDQFKVTAVYKEARQKGFVPSAFSQGSSNGIPFSRGTKDDAAVEAEEKKRFEQALLQIEDLKKLHPHAEFSISSPFALLTQDEFLSYVNRAGIDADSLPETNASSPSTSSTSSNAAGPKTEAGAASGETVDWSQQGCVTAVKDQGQCGACWAFSSTAAMESGYCIASGGTLPTLSEQQLISCDTAGENSGCGGGYAPYAMEWISQSRGGKMCTMQSYPFTSTSGSVASCTSSCSEVYIGVAGYDSARSDPATLEDQVREHPISMFVYSGSSAFQYYKGGILTGASCDKSGAHSVLAVGFGESSGLKYWKLKNQWGVNWGEQGYVRIERRYSGDSEGACGVELYGAWPTFSSNVTPTTAAPAATTTTPPRTTATPTTATPTTETPSTTATPGTAAPATAQVTETPAPTTTSEPTVVVSQNPTISVTVDPSNGNIQQSEGDSVCGRLDQGVDYLGSTFADQAAATVGDCCDLCRNTAGCNAFSFTKWQGGHCWLKTRAGLVVPNPSAVSSSLQDIGNATHERVPREFGYNYIGNDIAVVQSSTVDDCLTRCEANADCHAYTWSPENDGSCALKSSKPSATEYKSASAYVSAIVYKCANLQIKTDFKGQDLSDVRAPSPEMCCAICRQTKGCKAFSWSDFKSGTCWLKSGADDAIPLSGVVAATLS